MARFAFVTLVTSDSYAKGALVVAAALRELHPIPATPPEVPFDTVCIVTPETVDVSTIKTLRKGFDVVIGVEVIDENQASGLKLLGRPDLDLVLTKLHVFRLTQYEKIIFLDADILPVRSLSHLFTLPHEFSAVPDVGWPDIFNSGFMVLSPGEDKFNALMTLVKSKGSWDGGDQGLLNEWRGEDWNRLSFTYNTTPTAAYTYAPAYERFGSKISAVHFIGPNKPWASEPWRPPFARSSSTQAGASSTQRSYAYESLVDRWFDVYDRHFRSSPMNDQPSYTVRKYQSVWDAGSTPVASTGGFGLDELKRLALEGSSVFPGPSGEAEYRSLPLEGRLDLMRPKPPPPAPAPSAPQTSIHVPVGAVNRPSPVPHRPIAPDYQSGGDGPVYQSVAPTYEPDTFLDQTAIASGKPVPFVDQTVTTPWLSTENVKSATVVSAPQSESQAPPSGPVSAPHGTRDGFYEHSPPPPPSPPLINWNPAVEPPPSTRPSYAPQEPFGSHFTSVWDLPPTHPRHSHYHSDAHGHSSQHIPHAQSHKVPQSEDFFPVPSPPTIPVHLAHQGAYANVAHNRPDYSKVTKVFPWEEQPRRAPGRVFPITDPPPPGMPYLDQSKPLLSVQQPTPENISSSAGGEGPPQVSPSPSMHHGPPGSLVYANAWDGIPSIQRYASRLIQPTPKPASSVTPPLKQRARKNTEEHEPEDGHEGDDEDEGGESDEEHSPKSSPRRSVPSNRARGSHPRGPSGNNGDRLSLRRGSGDTQAGATTPPQYKSQGVQTVPKSRRDQEVQVGQEQIADVVKAAAPTAKPSLSPVTEQTVPPHRLPPPPPPSGTGGRYTPPGVLSPRIEDSQGPSPTERHVAFSSLAQLGDGPKNPLSSFQAIPRSARDTTYSTSPSASPTATLRERPLSSSTDPYARSSWISTSSSGATAVASDVISPREMSPSEGPAALPRIPAGRKWDPARGVDVFKRDNEEVLARFLRMGQWGGGDEPPEGGGGDRPSGATTL